MPLVPGTTVRPTLGSPPGVHAFIVGVSDYPDLPQEGAPILAQHFGMTRLETPAVSAYRIYQWLSDVTTVLARPLATCRMLLLPSPKELAQEPALQALTTSCTPADFLMDATQWREDAATSSDNITFFYFAGHGLRRSLDDSVMLLQGFGNNIGGALVNSVDIQNIFNGMSVTNARPSMARTQLYFVDACRNFPQAFKHLTSPQTTEVFPVDLSAEEKRVAPIFYAAASGARAGGLADGKGTFFGRSLIKCLTHDAADLIETDGQLSWDVSVRSLQGALETAISEVNAQYDVELDVSSGGVQKEAVICHLNSAPMVDVVIRVEPEIAVPLVQVVLRDDANQPVTEIPNPLTHHPFGCRLRAGFYSAGAQIPSGSVVPGGATPLRPVAQRITMVRPPRWEKILKVTL